MTSNLQGWAELIRRRARDAGLELPLDVVEELAVHLQETYARAMSRGETEVAARELARRTLEAATMADLAQRARISAGDQMLRFDQTSTHLVAGIWSDVRYTVRLLRRSPVFSVAVIGVLALSIGAVAAVFSIVHAVLLRPLPYPGAQQLAVLEKLDASGRAGQISAADWLDYTSRVEAFEGVTAYSPWTHNLSANGEPLRLRSIITTGNFFQVLGSAPAFGRVYGDADDNPSADTVVVLSAGLWMRRFGGDPQVIGRRITLSGSPALVVGVMPPAFEFPSRDVDLWMPIGMQPALKADRASEWLRTVVRIRKGASARAALDQAQAVASALAREYPTTNAGEQVALVPLKDTVVGDVRPALLAVGGAVAFVFLVACLNVVNLLLSRASLRREEMAVRLALGASTWHVTRQVLTESALMAVVAGTMGFGVSHGLLRGFVALAADRVPRLQGADLDGITILVGAVASGLVLAVCTVTSTLSLNYAGRACRLGIRVTRAHGMSPLLAAQIAVSFVLVASSLLLAGSFLRLQEVPLGFDGNDVLSLRVTLPRVKYPDSASHARFADAVTHQLAAVPGVLAAGVINDLPFGGNQMSFAITWQGGGNENQPPLRATVRIVDGGYFTALRIPLISGRMIGGEDTRTREPVALVNQKAADQYFGGHALDRRVRVGETREWRRVVGVVADTRHAGPLTPEGPVVYLPYAQKPFDFINWMGFLIRAPNVAALTGILKSRVSAVDPSQPVYDVLLVEDYVTRAYAPFRLNAWIVGGLAGLSLILAAAGVFAFASYNVCARRQELGIRLALGASKSMMVRLVLRQVLTLVLVGIAIGGAGAAIATRPLASLLFEMTPVDPRIYMGVFAVLLVAALIAGLPPAIRAANTDPLTSIRAE